MSRIRSKNTKIELAVRDLLLENGIKFKMHPKFFGTPDFLIGEKTIVFCDGDFWHGHDYRNGRVPPQSFWRNKIERNMKRDKKISQKLRRQGLSVIRLWEHDIRKRPDYCMKKILRFM